MAGGSIPTSGLTDGQDSVVEWMNRLGRGIDKRDNILSERTRYDVEQVNELAIKIDNWLTKDDRLRTLRSDTWLSDREAEVHRMKELGLTHDGILLFYLLQEPDGPTSKSTIHEYSYRIREKLKKSQQTVELISNS